MYNRYIPQSDGTYRRNAMPEQPRHQPPPPQQTAPPPPPPGPTAPQHRPPQPEPVLGFLRQLLPKSFDTGDLIIVLLLLLIAGDDPKSRSNALLTLALYFVL